MRTLSLNTGFDYSRKFARDASLPLPAGFPAALEGSYQQDIVPAKFRSFSQACMLCMLLYLSFGVLDIWALPNSLGLAWVVRTVVVLATLACLLGAWRNRQWFVRNYAVLTTGLYGLWGAGIEAIIASSAPGEASWTHYYAGLTLVTTALYTWTYVTPKAAGILGACLTIAYIAIATGLQRLHEGPESSALVAIVFFLVSTNLIGLLSMLARENFSRQAFLLKHMLRQDLENAGNEQRHSQHMSEHDHLTGLPNRLRFERRVHELFSNARLTGNSVGLLFIDLDGFKPINDQYGHAAGDAVLTDVAKKLMGMIRPEDLVARLGGDEFVIAIPLAMNNTDRIHSLRLALSIRIGQPLQWEGKTLHVTASIGTACYPEHGGSLSQVLAEADHAMYLDKQRAGSRRACGLRETVTSE
ncbi:diguanylate cyclase (GGDEF) domain-containing protein [Duganella sp. CF458]|uniref:GGDEF domain-containing protein n=1 Tax=Duganella sp. CF458 TaxID=1884368 RepID=UPI0008EDD7B1|nr:diguanylate cyclase [Duganella sp. CF458]SFG44890.1 diguanylate cyclase (GGDEF) domain-containing protein [Duganella sp. CF458]